MRWFFGRINEEVYRQRGGWKHVVVQVVHLK